MKTVALLLIATNKYKQFVLPLVQSARQFFVPDHPVTVHIFTDEPGWFINENQLLQTDRVEIVCHRIAPYKFPFATLYRYKIFTWYNEQIKEDYVFYSDVDILFVDTVGDEILYNGIVAVRHPGFYANNGWGSNTNPRGSMSWFPEDQRKHYYAGGFQGGERSIYLSMANQLKDHIEIDEKRGIMAEWHDETHFNKACNSMIRFSDVKSLTPSYCMPEQLHLRGEWKLTNLPVKIIALAKNHEELRS